MMDSNTRVVIKNDESDFPVDKYNRIVSVAIQKQTNK